MPWSIKQRDGKYCVVKEGASAPVPGGCHSSRADAIKHQRALYANEPSAMAGSVRDMASAPLKPPASWFGQPEADVPTPLTVTADGQVYGHLALWDSCHTGFLNGGAAECVRAPRSQTDYSYFHLGRMETAEGEDVAVGRITYGTGHAPLAAGLQAASSHYDNTGQVGAYVRAINGRFGPWMSGVLRSDISPEGVRDLKANPPSGDWRLIKRSLELIAALAVPVPGFPVQVAMTASGEAAALILGMDEEELPSGRDYMRRRAVIQKSLAG